MKRQFQLQYPLAKRPKDNMKGIVKFCNHCNEKIILRRWDSWNNFLVRCPFCKKLHGARWNAKTVLWVSFLTHAFSFFFTMRFRNALVTFIFFVFWALVGNYILEIEVLPQLLEVFGAVLFIFSPMIINGCILLSHNSHLKKMSSEESVLQLAEAFQDLVS